MRFPASAPPPGPTTNLDEAPALPLGRLVEGIYRRRWIVFGLCLLGALAGLAAMILRADRYRSEGVFLFDRGGEQLNIAPDPAVDAMVSPGLVGNLPYVLVSRELCERVVDAVGAEAILAPFRAERVAAPDAGVVELLRVWLANVRRDLRSGAGSSGSRGEAVSQLQQSLTVEVPRASSVLRVGYAAPDPLAARDTLRVYMDEAIKWHLEVYGDIREIELLEQGYGQARRLHDDAVTAHDEFLARLDVSDFDAALSRRRQELQTIQERLAAQEVQQLTQAKLSERLEQELEQLAPEIQVSERVIQADPRVVRLQEALDAKAKELLDLESRFRPDDVAIRLAKSSLEQIGKELEEARAQETTEFVQQRTIGNPRYQLLQSRLFDAQLEVETSGLSIERLRTASEAATKAVGELADEARQFDLLARRVAKTRQDLDRLEDRMDLARAKQSLAQHNLSSLSILQAPAAGERETVGGLKILAAALGAGLAVGFGLALVLAFVDRRIRDRRDLEGLVPGPVLGEYPCPSRKHLRRHLRLRGRGC